LIHADVVLGALHDRGAARFTGVPCSMLARSSTARSAHPRIRASAHPPGAALLTEQAKGRELEHRIQRGQPPR
jgi:hypothetical protein